MLFLPCGQLQRPDSKAHRIAGMQCGKLLQNQLDEMVSVSLRHSGRHLCIHNFPTRCFVTFNDGGDNFGQGLAIAQSENIRGYKVLFDRDILLARSLVGPYKDVTQEFDAVEFVDADHGVYIGLLRNVDEGQRAQVMANKRNVGCQPGNALVHILKRLQVGQVHHQEERLLEWVLNFCGHLDDDAKQFLQSLWQRHRKTGR